MLSACGWVKGHFQAISQGGHWATLWGEIWQSPLQRGWSTEVRGGPPLELPSEGCLDPGGHSGMKSQMWKHAETGKNKPSTVIWESRKSWGVICSLKMSSPVKYTDEAIKPGHLVQVFQHAYQGRALLLLQKANWSRNWFRKPIPSPRWTLMCSARTQDDHSLWEFIFREGTLAVRKFCDKAASTHKQGPPGMEGPEMPSGGRSVQKVSVICEGTSSQASHNLVSMISDLISTTL